MRVVIGEGLTLLREGLVRLFEANGFRVVAAVGDEPALRRVLFAEELDVAVVDAGLSPGGTDDGLRCAIDARAARPGLPVMVLSHHVDRGAAHELLAGGDGAAGYLLTDRVRDVPGFVDAVRRVARGRTVVDPEVVSALPVRGARPPDPLARLSPRERQVLRLMAEGRSNLAIADRMAISERTVGKHTSSIFTKLDLLPDEDDNRRVRAVLALLGGEGDALDP